MRLNDGALTAPLTANDCAEAARLHAVAFPGFFLASLGDRFLREFYAGFVGDPTAITCVLRERDGTLLGVAVGTTEPDGFFRRLLRRRLFGFGLAALLATARRPSTAPRLLSAVRYRGGAPESPPDAALLSSICVHPDGRGRGLGTTLLDAWTTEAHRLGAMSAYLTTDAVNNDAVIDFYRRSGWLRVSSFTTAHGRAMHCLSRVTERGQPNGDDVA